jgi:hypothetical protein
VKDDAAQALLSELVTERVKATAVPDATPLLCEGDSETAGLARVHGVETT